MDCSKHYVFKELRTNLEHTAHSKIAYEFTIKSTSKRHTAAAIDTVATSLSISYHVLFLHATSNFSCCLLLLCRNVEAPRGHIPPLLAIITGLGREQFAAPCRPRAHGTRQRGVGFLVEEGV